MTNSQENSPTPNGSSATVNAGDLRAVRQMLRVERLRRVGPSHEMILHYITDDGRYAETERVMTFGAGRPAKKGLHYPIGETRPCPLAGQRVPGTSTRAERARLTR